MFKNFLKITLRNLLRYKSFSFINLAGLAIGMTCFIFITLFVQDELSYDQFHANKDRIYRLVGIDAEGDGTTGIARVPAPWGPAMQQAFPEVEKSVRFRFYGRALVSRGDKRFYENDGLFADSTIFEIFTFPLVQGNPKSALTQPNTVVISEDFAQKYFGASEPLGQTLRFDDQEYKITGVVKNVPRNSHFTFDFLVSFVTYNFWDLNEWRVNNFHNYLLLAPNTTPEMVESKIPALLKSHLGEQEFGAITRLQKLQPLTDIHLRSHLFREFGPNSDMAYIYLFTAIAFFILLIACINFMNLATARASKRTKEVGLRKVVGAQRQQLVRQFLGESVLFAFLALLIAIGLVELLMPSFNQLTGRELAVSYTQNPLFVFGLIAVTLLVGGMAGSYPAFFLSAFRPISVLKGATATNSRSPLRKILVVVQFTISIALLIGTGVVFKQLNYIQTKKLGFNKDQVLVIRISESRVEQSPEPFKTEILQNPSIVSVAASDNLPGGSDWGMPLRFEGAENNEMFSTRVLSVDNEFINTLEMEIVAGRNFSKEFATDVSEAFVLNETAVRSLGWEDPLGRYLERPTGRGADGQWQWQRGKVIGVVKDFHFRSLHEEIQPLTLFMFSDDASYLNVKVRSEDLSETLAFLQNIWQKHEPTRPFDYFFMDEAFDQLYQSEQQLSRIFTTFSALALLIGCLGLFGLASFMAEQRTKEIGVRKVLGASVASIILLLSKEFTKLVAIAFVIAGAIGWFAMDKWLQVFAYRIELGFDIFLAAGLIALLIAWLTVSYQSIKAALANPVEALRYE